MSGDLVVTVDMVPSLLHLGLGPLAHAVGALSSRRQLQGEESLRTAALGMTEALKAARSDIEASYGLSLDGVGAVFA